MIVIVFIVIETDRRAVWAITSPQRVLPFLTCLPAIHPSIHRVFSTFSELGTVLIKKTEICFQISHLIHCRKSPEGGSVRGAP